MQGRRQEHRGIAGSGGWSRRLWRRPAPTAAGARLPVGRNVVLACGVFCAGPTLAAILLMHDIDNQALQNAHRAPRSMAALVADVASTATIGPAADTLFNWQELPAEQTVISLNTLAFPVRRRALQYADGSRDDILAWGGPDDPKAFGEILLRREAGPAGGGSMYVETARWAAREGAALLRLDNPRPLASRLGTGSVAEGQFGVDSGERRCVVFRIGPGTEGLLFGGWACGAEGKAWPPDGLACLLDRVRLEPDAGPGALKAHFTAASGRASDCAESRPAAIEPADAPVVPAVVKGAKQKGKPAAARQRKVHGKVKARRH